MKRKWQIGLASLFTGYYAVSYYAFKRMTRGKRKTPEMLLAPYTDEDRTFYHDVPFEHVSIQSRDDYRLYGRIYRNEGSTKWIVFVHGYTASHSFMAPHLAMFHRLGFNLLAVDLRSHGESEGVYASYGYHEKIDMIDWVDWLRENETVETVGLHGVSMGAATVLQTTPLTEVDFTIAECPFDDMKQLMRYQLKELHHIPAELFLPGINYFLWSRAGFTMNQVQPKKAVTETTTPILFVHGSKDDFVPTWMSVEMNALNRTNDIKLIDGAEHTDCIIKDAAGYEEAVTNFLYRHGLGRQLSQGVHESP
ncbi:alpha/beta hydrolase [Exiguobacterium sp. s63]|uniref:alpha/beta hydrolase n=1 Tax=Exiguobacterium sp. s63 TaxID=2751274 RepID=UPI001BE82040|nr:alpha/beta hydrolase [Exiguobacterium sp. s63]